MLRVVLPVVLVLEALVARRLAIREFWTRISHWTRWNRNEPPPHPIPHSNPGADGKDSESTFDEVESFPGAIRGFSLNWSGWN